MERNIDNLKGKVVKHFKGKLYLVLDVARHSETMEELVVYKALYGEFGIFVRPLDMFLSKVDKEKYPNCTQKYRFQEINEEDIKLIQNVISK
ncbi:DUF1653 domain-containing protein [Clostridium baratii]|uniref:DUF1653 domain-containing protein n=1 Tax=Clostridium baratii TaxID=1561 RepID=UPI0005F2CA61|nr:DUF1653 domain-containing protein [Clostridium baratii]KJU72506.1 hypothetical protein UC77_03575 [Clostridium baratii]MDY3207111.1 DUF1653 domain-containing protein [Clostridium baratii]